jgi:divalent metal cation (Fe/Co/Zn/Cd) transporter
MTLWTIPIPTASRPQWLAYARYLALFTIFYNLLEGLVSMGFGWADDSMALFGFGADSFIEVGSALLVLWRLRGDEVGCASERLQRERRAAMGIGSLFVLLALGTSIGAVIQLASHHHPETTVPGLLVSVLSLGFMFWLWKSKRRAAKALDSRSLEGDAACSLACIQLSTVLFAGSLTFLLAPALWWVDAGAALVLSAFIAREGLSSIRASLKPDFTGGCGCHE